MSTEILSDQGRRMEEVPSVFLLTKILRESSIVDGSKYYEIL